MKKEIIRENEINLSHYLSGKASVKKEKLVLREFQDHKITNIFNLKTA